MPEFKLDRFLTAQRNVYETALQEIRAGRKRTHWMWFVFPQIIGLGSSDMAVFYAIGSIEEARAYFAHPVLGTRLVEITDAMNVAVENNPVSILGPIDAAKFLSCMTLFARTASGTTCFHTAIEKFFGGQVDELTNRQFTVWEKDTDN